GDEGRRWGGRMGMEEIYYTDLEFLRKLGVEIVPPVPVEQVIGWMSRATFSPVIYRPLFSHLRLVTCRTFETPAAGTLPLFGLDAEYVREIYGERAIELILPAERPEEKVRDMLSRPDYYAGIVRGIRRRLAERHSYEARLRELLRIVAG